MTIEDLLVDLGDNRIDTNRYWGVVLGMVNSHLPADAKLVKTQSGNEVISAIYGLQDDSVRAAILTRPYMSAPPRDNFRLLLLMVGFGFTAVAVSLALVAIFSDDGSAGAYELLQLVIKELIRLSTVLLPSPPPPVTA